jgi:hypothetical protein
MALIEDGVEQEVAPQEQPEPKPGKGGKDDSVTLSKAEHEALIRDRDEARESEKFWAQKARGGKEDPAEPEEEEEPKPEPEPEEPDPEKFVDELAKDGLKALRKYGFMTRAQAEKLADERAEKMADKVVDRRVKGMQSDTQLVTDFKDIRDPKSELFKTAAPIYQKLVAMNGGKQTTALLYAAAEAAQAKLDAKAPPPKPRRDEDDYDRYEPEEDRRARARAQGSERGRPAPVQDDDAGDLGPEALEICKAMGVKPEEYIASQKQLGARRRR